MHAETARKLAAVSLLIALGSGCGGGSAGTPEQDAGHALPDARPAGAPDAAQAGAPDASTEPDGGCTGETDLALCAAHGAECGELSATDRCGAPRQLASCGTCTGSRTCGGGGTPNVCGSTAPAPDCASAPLRTSGTVYYYCDCQDGAAAGCVAGSDDSGTPGTSPGAPRRTLADAQTRWRDLPAGGTVALCRGGAWNEGGLGLLNENCRASEPCEFRDYTPGWASAATPRPRINAGAQNGISFVPPGSIGHYEGFRLWNLDIRQTNTDNTGIFIYEDVTDLDVCNVRLDGGHLGFYPTGSENLMPARITLRHSQLYNHGFSGVLAGLDGLVIDSNYFENNGLEASMFDHTIYAATSRGMRITNNEMRTDERCGGVMLVVHGLVTDLLVENNLILTASTNGYCYAAQTAGSAAYGEMHEVRFLRNRITTAGPTALEVSVCSDCLVADNVIMGGATSIGTTLPGGNTGPTTRVTAQNNTLYQSALTIGAQGDGYVVENNAVWTEGSSCFDLRAPTARNSNNYCRTQGGAAAAEVWADPANGNFLPAASGPLIGAASQSFYSPIAIGTVVWSPADLGVERVAPIDIGAYQH